MKEEYYEDYISDYDFKENVCKICGESFKTLHSGKGVCSKKCERKRNSRALLEKKKETDFLIFQRDNFRCIYCGRSSIEDGVKLEIEHIYPIRKGGDSQLFNLVISCKKCNSHKATMVLSEDNILRLWTEVQKRTDEAGVDQYKKLQKKFRRIQIEREKRLI